VLEQITDAFMVMDKSFRFVYANPVALRMAGLTAYEILGRNYFDLMPHLRNTVVWDEYHRALETGVPARFQYYSEATSQWLEIRAFPSLVDLTVYFTDITQKKKEEGERARREEALFQSEARYRSIFQNVANGIAVLKGGVYLDVNPAMCQMLGYSRDEIVGRPPQCFMLPGNEPLRAEMKATLDATGQWHGEFPLLHAEGRLVEIQWSMSRGLDGTLLAVAVDITERKAAEERARKANEAVQRSEQRLRRLLEAATVGVIVNDAGGRITYANDPFLRMLGYTRDDVTKGNLTWKEIQAPDRVQTDSPALAQLDATGTCEPYETEFIARDGRRIPVYIGAAVLPDDHGVLGATFVTDLTPLKQVQHELEALNEELDQRVRVRTAELERAYRDQESYNYSISHDLRAPLRAISATARMIEEDHGEGLTEGARALLKRQALNANRLGRLVDELLNLSRLGQQEMEVCEVDLSALAREVTAELGGGERVRIQEGLVCQGDGVLLRLVWQNLIGNALKFSTPDTTIDVGGSVSPNGTAYWVRDRGIGFDMAYLAKLFRPFERLVGEHEFSGTGIGLANVKRIVERHGGRVWAEGQPGKGATFYFTLG
jgi:PAS domain S-box-containing protein